jgi:hypothetical protein
MIPAAVALVESRGGPDGDRLAALRRGLLRVHLRRLVSDAAQCDAQDGVGHLSGSNFTNSKQADFCKKVVLYFCINIVGLKKKFGERNLVEMSLKNTMVKKF